MPSDFQNGVSYSEQKSFFNQVLLVAFANKQTSCFTTLNFDLHHTKRALFVACTVVEM